MFATPERACSGYLVETGGKRIWLDAGSGTWRNLLGLIGFDTIDAIVLTHRHPDHTTDVFQCFHARRYGTAERLPKIPLFAPAETLDRLTAFSTDLNESFDLEAVADGDSVELGGAVSFVKMAHPVETLGVRIDSAGSVCAYSADSGPDADFETLAHGANVLLSQATFQDSDPEREGHTRASEPGSLADSVGVERLVLTHLPANRDLSLSLAQANASANGVDVSLASDGLRIEV